MQQFQPDKKRSKAPPAPTPAAPTTAAGSSAGGYDAQRAAQSPDQADGSYDSQRDALRPGVTSVGGVTLDVAPDGPTHEPSRKKKKKKRNRRRRKRRAAAKKRAAAKRRAEAKKRREQQLRNNPQPTPQPAPQPAPTIEPTPEPEPEPEPVVKPDPKPEPKPEPEPEPVVPLDPMMDPDVNPDPTNEYAPEATYAEFSGTIAVKGEGDAHAIDANDVKQGSIGNCYFVAQLAAMAMHKPDEIADLINDNGNGTYTVSLWLKDKKQPWRRTKTDIVVSSQFPTKGGGKAAYAKPGDKGSDGPELWVMLIEKAFAKYTGNYEETRGKKTKDGDVFAMMTGKTSGYKKLATLSDDALLRMLTAAVTEGNPISFGAHSTRSLDEEGQKAAKEAGVVLNHAYAMQGVDAKKRTISLYNPWGVRHLTDMDVGLIKRFYSNVKIGA
ncbi:MAG: hypothetical protein KC502_09515 [Myxococcales bacterium]|nr:hypothetical protein [Myxococcales bacterium]